MITPIRGRKQYKCPFTSSTAFSSLKDDNPDKGTETLAEHFKTLVAKLKDDNPDKGTETDR